MSHHCNINIILKPPHPCWKIKMNWITFYGKNWMKRFIWHMICDNTYDMLVWITVNHQCFKMKKSQLLAI